MIPSEKSLGHFLLRGSGRGSFPYFSYLSKYIQKSKLNIYKNNTQFFHSIQGKFHIKTIHIIHYFSGLFPFANKSKHNQRSTEYTNPLHIRIRFGRIY